MNKLSNIEIFNKIASHIMNKSAINIIYLHLTKENKFAEDSYYSFTFTKCDEYVLRNNMNYLYLRQDGYGDQIPLEEFLNDMSFDDIAGLFDAYSITNEESGKIVQRLTKIHIEVVKQFKISKIEEILNA